MLSDAPKDVSIQISPHTEVRSGEQVLLQCEFSSSRPADVHYLWKKDGNLLEKRKTLTFDSISPEDSGTYHCLVNNSIGQTSSEACKLQVLCEWLELEADSRDGQRTRDLNPDFACPADAPRRLRVSISPKDGVVEGKMAILTCESDANPAPSHYNWFDGNNQDLQHYGQTLRLEPVKLQHSGSYWCRGANRLGQSQSPPTTLTVYCKGPFFFFLGPGHSWGFLLGCVAVCSDHIPDLALPTLPPLQGPLLHTQLFHLPFPAQSLQTPG